MILLARQHTVARFNAEPYLSPAGKEALLTYSAVRNEIINKIRALTNQHDGPESQLLVAYSEQHRLADKERIDISYLPVMTELSKALHRPALQKFHQT